MFFRALKKRPNFLSLFVIVLFFGSAVLIISPVFGDLFIWHRVISARAKRIAAEYAPYCKTKAHKKATFLKCLYGIGRT